MTRSHDEAIAIVGFGGVLPGATDVEDFWANVLGGIDSTREVPAGRWNVDPAKVFDPAVARPDKVYSKQGGFIEDFRLDPESLDLEPSLLDRLDPVFHLALHAARAAWRSARTEDIDRRRVGVIFGNIVLPTERSSSFSSEILERIIEQGIGMARPTRDEPASGTDPLNAFPAGLPASLVSHALGLGGTSYTLDAACASSLYALKLAADELRAGRADAMISGGLSRPDPLYTQMGFSQLQALSMRGKPAPFDAEGDGLVVGEGVGLFVLKRLG